MARSAGTVHELHRAVSVDDHDRIREQLHQLAQISGAVDPLTRHHVTNVGCIRPNLEGTFATIRPIVHGVRNRRIWGCN